MKTKNSPRKSNPEDRAAKVQAAKDALADGLRALVTGSDWQGVLDAMAKRSKLSPSRFSFNNQLLVAIQKPNARFVATFEAWKRQGRFVQKGEKGIAILQPCPWKRTEKNAKGEEVEVGGVFFKILYVFALEQTEGAEFDTGEDVCQDVTGEAPVADLAAFAKKLDAVGSVELRSRQAFDPDKAFGWYNRTTKGIVVVTGEDRSEASLFATLVHEVAHAILHGIEDHHDRGEKEIEAESVSYVVCKALGLDTAAFSFPYVATWAGRSKDALKEIEKSGSRIAKAAEEILSAIEPAAEEAASEAA